MKKMTKDQLVFADTVLKVFLNATGKEYVKANNLQLTYLKDEGCYQMTPGQISGLPTDAFRFKNERQKAERIYLSTGNLKGRKGRFVMTKFDYVNKGNNMQYNTAQAKIHVGSHVVNATCRYRVQEKKNSSVYLDMPDGSTFKADGLMTKHIKAKIKSGSEINLKQL